MNEKKSYKVQIFEEHYVLLSDDAESLVVKAAELVDATMNDISQHSTITDPKKIAVLSALRLADQLLCLEQKYQKKEQSTIALEKYIDQELSILNL